MLTKAKSTSREWYRAYCSAMLETDVTKIFESVEFARKAIQERAKELTGNFSGSNHESNELERALRFLAMLVDCSQKEQGSLVVRAKEVVVSSPRAFATAVQ